MIDRTIARRYAQALFAIARESDKIKQFEDELTLVVDTIQASPELEQVLEHQLIEPEAKKELLEKVFRSQVSQEILNFVKLVCDKRRERYLSQMLREYIAFADEARNVLAATVRTAKELTPEHYQGIKEKLSKMTGKEIRLETKVDPELIAGVVVKIGDRVYDGSVANRLSDLKTHLTKVHFSKDRGEVADEH
ncbi:F0F1 ATP synthase subunit delta [Metallumcola ferriviriculae]|uniref:ATP synthase subunit delta n=1 Tax=Metallumcola ferriviriculae TaxID=3039180 RepID=A0AAU0UNQ8_9FIRM|nr:F0F1 ATP synthase subunit delta [Desulfitibacteraceae bacterium MK1]